MRSSAAILTVSLCLTQAVPFQQTVFDTKSAIRQDMALRYGLSENNLRAGEIAFGFLPAFGEAMSPNDITSINRLLPKPMSVIGTYIQIKPYSYDFSQIDNQVNEVLRQQGDKPVLQIALMPSSGFDKVDQNMANAIGRKMRSINDKGINVWLRFAHEANGDWMPYGEQPQAFVQKWQLVTNAVRAQTKQTWMLWSPNLLFSWNNDLTEVHGGYTPYWPGRSYVDLVGLSFYKFTGSPRQNVLIPKGWAINALRRFDQAFGSPLGLPLVLSETAAPYNMDPDSGKPTSGGATSYDIKVEFLRQLLNPAMKRACPSLLAITWFEIKKNEGSPLVTSDFRLVTGSEQLRNKALNMIQHTNNSVVDDCEDV